MGIRGGRLTNNVANRTNLPPKFCRRNAGKTLHTMRVGPSRLYITNVDVKKEDRHLQGKRQRECSKAGQVSRASNVHVFLRFSNLHKRTTERSAFSRVKRGKCNVGWLGWLVGLELNSGVMGEHSNSTPVCPIPFRHNLVVDLVAD